MKTIYSYPTIEVLIVRNADILCLSQGAETLDKNRIPSGTEDKPVITAPSRTVEAVIPSANSLRN